MKIKANTKVKIGWMFLWIFWSIHSSGQNSGCLYSTHFDKNSPKTVIGSWHNYVTEVRESKLIVTLDEKNGNQWYNWSLEYIGEDGKAAPLDFSIPENKPVVHFRAKASDTVSLSVLLIDTEDQTLGSDAASSIGIIDLVTEFREYEINFSGLFYNEWKNYTIDSSSIRAIIFAANAGYESFPFENSFGQLINKPFGGTIEFDWIGTGKSCYLPENYLNFSVDKKICKDSLATLFNHSGNFINDPEVLLDPGTDGEIASVNGDSYIIRYSSVGDKTIEMSFSDPDAGPSYYEMVKVKDCTPGHFDQKIVGYISSYGDASAVDYANLTHAMFAFLDVKPDGSIGAYTGVQQNNFEKFLEATAKANTQRIISIRGSASPLAPGWTGIEEVAKNPQAIHRFADTIVKYCLHHQLDGVDIDWEGLSTVTESDRYTQLMDTLYKHLHDSGLLLISTLPFNSWWGQWFSDEALEKADWLQIMVYDAKGSWEQSPFGNHSSFQDLVDAENYWTGRGYSRDKLVMGVPFYGYKFKSASGGLGVTYAYKDIVALFPMMDNSMDQTPGNDLTLFNGPDLIKKKCKYLKEKDFGGVMIWEMTLDAPDHKSLHQHILCAFKDDIGCTEFKPCEEGDISTGLVGQWDFDGDAMDKSGNGLHATIEKGIFTHDRFGTSGNAIQSDNHALHINCGSDESLTPDNLSISLWINPAQLADGQSMELLSMRAGCKNSYSLSLDWDQVVCTFNAQDKKYVLKSRTWLIPGNWYHIAVTHSYENGTRLYINGLPDKQDTSKFYIVKEVHGQECGHENLLLGGTGYDVILDDLKIYNRELLACDIDGLFYPYYDNVKITGITNKSEELGVNVFPNPSKGNYMVSLPTTVNEEAIMTITNAMGQKVGEYILKEPVTEVVQESEEGIYFLNITLGNRHYSKKIIIESGIK
ncbi:MAG TPA: glycosyl hydrolase family 18 protein [Cytophagaceae bacterium]